MQVGVLHLIERVGRLDGNLQFPARDQPGQYGEHAGASSRSAAVALDPVLPDGLEVGNCVDAGRLDAEVQRDLHVVPAERVDEGDPVTPGPVAATMPARSLPSPDGNVAGNLACSRPSRILASPGLIPVALTWTSTWPGSGTGRGASITFRTSTPPYASNRTAFGIATPLRFGLTAARGRLCPEAELSSPESIWADGAGGLRPIVQVPVDPADLGRAAVNRLGPGSGLSFAGLAAASLSRRRAAPQ